MKYAKTNKTIQRFLNSDYFLTRRQLLKKLKSLRMTKPLQFKLMQFYDVTKVFILWWEIRIDRGRQEKKFGLVLAVKSQDASRSD